MTAKRSTSSVEEARRARALPLVDRAKRIAAMLDRWEAEDVSDEPDWDVQDVGRVALRMPTTPWAEARNAGVVTAPPEALDGDVVLAAQAIEEDAVIVTSNVRHFEALSVRAVQWMGRRVG